MGNDSTPPAEDQAGLTDILESLQETYKEEMPSLLDGLSEKVGNFRKNITSSDIFEDARNEAHKLKGTSGSYGLAEFSTIFAAIEKMLLALGPESKSDTDSTFAEIDRKIEEARNLL